MSLGQREKCSIAWFVLAEFIRKGERERALTMYRLLMHTIDNPAFCIQVEADLLAYLNNPLAIERYKQAAILYSKQHDYQAACSIYEQLVGNEPKNTELQQLLFQSYNRLGQPGRVQFFLHSLTKRLITQDDDIIAEQLLYHAQTMLDQSLNSNDVLLIVHASPHRISHKPPSSSPFLRVSVGELYEQP